MFDGVPEQFHQFIGVSSTTARTTTSTLLLPLSFTNTSNGFTSFDPLFTSSSSHPQHQQPQFLQPLHQQKNSEESTTSLAGMNMEINETDHQRSMAEQIDNLHHQPWSNEEVLALLRVRSSLENWFPDFTWEHVSRKLAELGFKRSAEKCKEKFEEESRYFNTIDCSKNYRIFSELEQLCQSESPHHLQHHHQAAADENNRNAEKSREDEDNVGQNLEDDSRNVDELYKTSPTAVSSDQDNKTVVDNKANDANKASTGNKKKRKRYSVKKLEMFKGFCEEIVNKLMIQQEEMHNKLLEDMVKRDEEKVAREEAWKKQELDKFNQELEVRVKEQTIAGDRQATIIKFLTKFSQNGSSKKQCFEKVNEEDLVKVQNESSNPPIAAASSRNPNPIINDQNKVDEAPQNPNPKTLISSSASQNPSSNPLVPTSSSPLMVINKATQNPTSNEKEDLGKRWPRDEVLALINLRCGLYNNGDNDKLEGAAIKAPVWERISQGMLELGYKRSAKRCKEKWENINKYFRKTKDANNKRSLDSRTCPYFHQLSTLYNQGTLISPSEWPENIPGLPENNSELPETGSAVQVSEGVETNMVHQVPDHFCCLNYFDHHLRSSEEKPIEEEIPPESFRLSKDAEFDWFDRNAIYERKDSHKGNSVPNSTNLNPNSNSNSQRFSLIKSKASIIGLPIKSQKSCFIESKNRKNTKPGNTRLFPK